jgi:hypothetical protein
MARISIYVPDDLKARMDAIGEAANWSDIVRPAIFASVTSLENRKDGNMSTVVERLRASRDKAIREVTGDAEAKGREWAQNTAEYEELKRVHERYSTGFSNAPYNAGDTSISLEQLVQDIDPLHRSQPRLIELMVIGLEDHIVERNRFAHFFAKGAVEFFEEVKDKL